MSVIPTAPPKLKRLFPHVEDITDWRAQQTIRLLWDRIFDLESRLQAHDTTLGDLASAANSQDDALTRLSGKADEALALAQLSRSEQRGLSEGAGGGLPGGGDGGEGAAGCAEAGSSGDITVSGLTAREAGKVVCGTGHEYPGLLDPATDQPTREAEAEELMLRMVWHLKQAGFTAGRQRNPSGLLSKDKLAVIVDGTTRAYDVMQMNPYTDPMSTQMLEVGGANLVDDPGIAD